MPYESPRMTNEPPRVSRRTLLGTAVALTALTGATSACGSISGVAGQTAGSPRLRSPETFATALAIPTLQEGRIGPDGVREFNLTAQEGGASDFGGAAPTPTWGFDGNYLGPTLRARQGEDVRVTVTNELGEMTTVHWHGMHLPAKYDGGPHQPIEPGGTWVPAWQIKQEPATLWYHPHPHGATEEHVYRGLAGFFLLDPADGTHTFLPHRYGIDDIPVVVQDKKLNADGTLNFDDTGNEIGLLGDTVLTNGTHGAYFDVTTSTVRLRLLNGSTARSYRFGFEDDREFQLIGTDGGLLERPVPLDRIAMSPGERAEILVSLEPGETVRLRSDGADLGEVVVPQVFGDQDVADLLELRAAASLEPSQPLPETLTTIERLDPADAVRERRFVFEGRNINGKRMAMDRIDETVTVDTTEIWEVHSRNLFPHNFHAHDVQFQVLTIDGQAPPPQLAGWKDTVYLEPQRTYRLIMHFADYVDTVAPYMFHCHLLLHEDDGMMGQFVVVNPGDSADTPTTVHGDH